MDEERFLQLAAYERKDERALRNKINRVVRSGLGRAATPTDETVQQAIKRLEDSRSQIVQLAVNQARASAERGYNEASQATRRNLVSAAVATAEQQAMSDARAYANKEVDLRIRQLERVEALTPAGTARLIADMRSKAANNLGRAVTHASQARTFYASLEGLPVKVAWITALDERVRHSHAAIHGQIRTVGELFPNGCRHPHDPDAPIEETINCRCRLKVVTVGALSFADSSFLDELPVIF